MSKQREVKGNTVPRSSSLRWLWVDELHVDSNAQRPLRPGWVKGHVSEFDPEQIGYIVVNERKDGKWYVIDGQHRVALIQAVWPNERQQVQCEAFIGLTVAQEAELFLARNDRINVRAYDKFRVAITAGEGVESDIYRIVLAQGLAISDQEREGTITAVKAIQHVHRGDGIAPKDGPAALARTLKTVQRAWGRGPSSFNGHILRGIGLVQLRYNGKLDQEALAEKLGPTRGGAPGILGTAKQVQDMRSQPLHKCVAAVVVDIYNRGRRNGKIQDWWA